MKTLITSILIVISYSVGMGQGKDSAWGTGMTTGIFYHGNRYVIMIYDTVTACRFIEDSVANTYEVEYRYVIPNDFGTIKDPKDLSDHRHFVSLVNIIAFKGNKQHTIAYNIKAIYSPTECQSDNRELWLKRLYEYQKGKQK